MGDRAITLSLYAIGGEDDILAAKTRLAALAGTIVSLSWRSLPGEYQGRMSLGAWEDKWAGDHQIAALVQAEIDAHPVPDRPQPIHRAQNGANTIHAQRQPAMLAHMDAHPRRRCQDRQHQGRARPQLAVTSTTAITGRISIDTDPDHRELRVNGNLMTPTLESDYFPLLPGLNTLTLTGATAASLAYGPLTLI